MNWKARAILGACLFLAGCEAQAAQLTLEWDAPTTYTDGQPIAEPLTYRVIKDGEYLESTDATSYPIQVGIGSHCFQVIAVVIVGDQKYPSAPSETACATVEPGTPNAPGNLRITL